MDAEEVRERIEAERAVAASVPCPRCGLDSCSCYASGEFWTLQRQLRAAEVESKTARAYAQRLAGLLARTADHLEGAAEQERVLVSRARLAVEEAQLAGVVK